MLNVWTSLTNGSSDLCVLTFLVAMLYVDKDLSAIVKAVFDSWPERKVELQWKYLHACDARLTPSDVIRAAEKGELLPDMLQHLNNLLKHSFASLGEEVRVCCT